MIYKRVENALRGHVTLDIECAMPERVINLCGAHEIPFWNLQWVDEIHLTLETTRGGLRTLRPIAERVGAHITVRRTAGLPFLMHRLRRRYVLWGALAAFVLISWWGNTFVWNMEVQGNDTVPAQTILRALEKQGIKAGIRATAIDQDRLRNRVLQEVPDLVWLAVNVRGCTAHVQVVERRRPPEIHSEENKTNVMALRSGTVVKTEVLAGEGMVYAGDTVEKGELLISGAIDPESGGLRLCHARGCVYARTWYEFSIPVSLICEERGELLRTATRRRLLIGKKEIIFPLGGSTWQGDCDKITSYDHLLLPFGIALPVTWVKETSSCYGKVTLERPIAEAEAAGEKELMDRLTRELTEGAEVLSTEITAEQQGTTLTVTLRAQCLEQIGQTVPIV